MNKAYKNKYHTARNIAIGATLIALSALLAAVRYYQTAKGLKMSQNLIMWTMDEKCFDQLEYGDTLRITVEK